MGATHLIIMSACVSGDIFIKCGGVGVWKYGHCYARLDYNKTLAARARNKVFPMTSNVLVFHSAGDRLIWNLRSHWKPQTG